MNESTSRLIVRRGKSPQSEYALSEQAVILGREAINDIMLQELEISRRHASITFVDGRHIIADLDSTNGTFVNGRRISTPITLRDGDVIDLGDSVSLVYSSPTQPDEATIVESMQAIGDMEAVEPSSEPAQAQYQPPPEVPQFSQQQASPAPAPTWEVSDSPSSYEDPAQFTPVAPPKERRDRRRLYFGCGCLVLLLVFGCIASFAALDAYQDGDLLYCQSLRPIWETIFSEARLVATCQ
jgi:pilus assembly protein CpaF